MDSKDAGGHSKKITEVRITGAQFQGVFPGRHLKCCT